MIEKPPVTYATYCTKCHRITHIFHTDEQNNEIPGGDKTFSLFEQSPTGRCRKEECDGAVVSLTHPRASQDLEACSTDPIKVEDGRYLRFLTQVGELEELDISCERIDQAFSGKIVDFEGHLRNDGLILRSITFDNGTTFHLGPVVSESAAIVYRITEGVVNDKTHDACSLSKKSDENRNENRPFSENSGREGSG